MKGKRVITREFLDERLTPELEPDTLQYFDHVRRYLVAQMYVQGNTVLDLACGTGYGSDILLNSGARMVVGGDVSRDALDYAAARRSPRLRLAQLDVCGLPFASASADVIVSLETLEHVAAPGDFLAEAARVLRPDGRLILSTPNRAVVSPGSAAPYSPYHSFEPTLDELRALLEGGKWRILALHGVTHSLRAARLFRAATAPFRRQTGKVDLGVYVRLLVRDWLPPALYRWQARRRGVPALDLSDAVITERAGSESSYFLAVCARS